MKYLISVAVGAIIGTFTWIPNRGLAQEIPKLKQQMPYSQVRQLLLDSGWQTLNIPPNQRDYKLIGVEQYVVEQLGYGEMVACSGTGQGFCRFEFAAAAGRKLIIITTPGEQELQIYSWWSEKLVR
jgi:hypothetical protein